jgi:glycerol-3-phosphate dehydrogenase subunit C
MAKLTQDKLMTLEAYAKARNTIRADVMAHKKNRNVALGDHVTLIFEDEQTIRYQVQEMLRAEKMFEEAGIQDEIDAYNPLIPDGSNWKATMMIEYEDVEERRHMLTQLLGIEDRVWVGVAGFERVYAIADEDLERATEQKTSAVHFLRLELTPDMSRTLKQGALLSMGVDHPAYQAVIDPVPPAVYTSTACSNSSIILYAIIDSA